MSKLIVTADWHLREDAPICRDPSIWIDLQRKAVRFVFQTAKECGAEVCLVGDEFHRSHVHPKMLSMLLSELFDFGVILHILAGNHSVPYHSIEDEASSTFGNLWRLTKIKESPVKTFDDIGSWYHFGELSKCKDQTGRDPSLVFLHELTFADDASRPGPIKDKAFIADDLFDLFPAAQFIFTGDNHQHFAVEKSGRWVINPGCLLRQSADEIDGVSGFYYVDTDENKVEFIQFIDNEVVDNSHLLAEKERDERVDAFISSLADNEELSLDFLSNLEIRRFENKSALGSADKVISDLLEEVL
jgi:DNA repair exonuclease SbcCD nuclease subunit